jgi:DNA-binding CsgD family transcriptional regulator
MELGKHLSKRDAVQILEIASHCLDCASEDEFRALVLDMRDLIVFDYAIAGYEKIGELLVTEGVPQETVININYPAGLMEWFFSHSYHRIDPVLIEFFRTFEIQNWQEVTDRCLGGKKDIVTLQAEAFGLRDGFAYGVRDFNLTSATCFFLAGKRVENNGRTRAIIKFAVPHLSEALKRVLARKVKTAYYLTPREVDVLKWLKEGKSSWDISMILVRSEDVVNFHIKNIVRKLDAMNRTHAVAIALQNGLIEL